MKNLLFFTFSIFVSLSVSGREPIKPSQFLSPEEKVYGLAKFWQEANYNFIFMDRVDKQAWDSTFKAMIPLAMESKNDYEYYRLLERLCAMLNDGHSYLWRQHYKNLLEDNPNNTIILPQVYNFFDKGMLGITDVGGVPVVNKVDKELAKQVPLGTRIVSVNGMPVEDYIREYTLPYVGQNSDHLRRIQSVEKITHGLDGDKVELGYVTSGGKSDVISLVFDADRPSFEADQVDGFHNGNYPWQLTRYREAEKGIGYLQLNSFGNYDVVEEFKNYLPEIKNVRALIIDLRYNSGGNTNNGTAILQYFSQDSILYGSKSETRKNVSAWKAWGQYRNEKDTVGNEWATNVFLASRDKLMEPIGTMDFRNSIPEDERMIIPIVVLTGYDTASAAEDFLIFSDTQPNITRMGTRSFGSTGQPLSFPLPGGIGGNVCTKNDTYPDGREFVGPGVIPHIEVVPTLEELLTGEDLTLQAAIDYLKGKI